MDTREVCSALRGRYSGAEWAFLTEVPNGTGMAKSRSADAIAMSLWPSRGLELHGIEIKVSRQDWLRELKDPAKAEDICRYCDRWWLAVGDPDIVRIEELPPTWGLLIPRGKNLVQKVEAPKLKPVEMDRCFLAGLLRRASEQLIPKDERAEYNRGFEKGQKSNESSKANAERELSEYKQSVADFEKQSGISIHRWSLGDVGRLVSLIRDQERCFDLLQVVQQKITIHSAQVELLTELTEKLNVLQKSMSSHTANLHV